MQPVSSLSVFCADGHTCNFEPITPLYSQCGEIVIPVGTHPHHVKVNPTAITIIPTPPTPTGYPQDNGHGGKDHGHGGKDHGHGDGKGHGHGDGKGHGDGNNNGGSDHPPPTYCKDPLLDIDVDLLGIDIDVSAYLDLSGLLDSVGDLLSGLLGGLLGGGKKDSGKEEKLPRRYEAHCGTKLKPGSGSDTKYITAKDAPECAQRCEEAGIKATVELGNLVDCLGVTIDRGISVDNCLFVLGDKNHILDLDLDLLGGNSNTDTLINLKLS